MFVQTLGIAAVVEGDANSDNVGSSMYSMTHD